LLAKDFEVLLAEPVGDTGDFDSLLELMASKVLQEVAEVSLIAVVFTAPLVHVGVCGQVLATDAISTSVRVNIAVLEDNWLHVLVNLCDDTSLGLVNLIEAKVLGKVHDLRTLERKRRVEVGVHHI